MGFGPPYRWGAGAAPASGFLMEKTPRNILDLDDDWTFPVRGIFYKDGPMGGQTDPVGAMAGWEARDELTGEIVGTCGPTPAGITSLTITRTAPAKCRAVRVYARCAEGSAVPYWGTSRGGGSFLVAPAHTPGTGDRPATTGTNDVHSDHDAGIAAWYGIPIRWSFTDLTIWNDPGQRVPREQGIAYAQAHWVGKDSARPVHQLINLHQNDPAHRDLAVTGAAVTALVAHFYPLGVTRYAWTNEPDGVDGSGRPGAPYVPDMQQFYAAVKAGHPDAKVAGLEGVFRSGNQLNNRTHYLRAGGGQYVDVISDHVYNNEVSDLHLADRSWDGWEATLARFGQDTKPDCCTESSGGLVAWFGARLPVRAARILGFNLLHMESRGLPKEANFIYYTRDYSHLDYPGHDVNDMGNPSLRTLVTRTIHTELAGTTSPETQRPARIDFGADNNVMFGVRYNRGDGSRVLALMSMGRATADVTLAVDGADDLTIVDCCGNADTAAVDDGRATVTVGMLPTFVRVPAGVPAAVVPVVRPERQLTAVSCSTGSYSGVSGTTQILSLIAGPYRDRRWNDHANSEGGPDSFWQSGQPITAVSPQTIEATAATPAEWALLRFECPTPSQDSGIVLDDADVQVRVGGAWVTAMNGGQPARVERAGATVVTHADGIYGWYQYNEQMGEAVEEHVFDVVLDPPVHADGVRLIVHSTGYGTNYNAAAAQPNPVDDPDLIPGDGGTRTPRVAMQKIRAFGPASDGDVPSPDPEPAQPSRYLVRAAG